jgi:hypothetical protein
MHAGPKGASHMGEAGFSQRSSGPLRRRTGAPGVNRDLQTVLWTVCPVNGRTGKCALDLRAEQDCVARKARPGFQAERDSEAQKVASKKPRAD